jgi:hypothetical protein
VRIVLGLFLMLSLTGCSAWEWLGLPDWFSSRPCAFCPLAPEEAFDAGEAGALLVMGVTVKAPASPEPLEAEISWLVETLPGAFPDLRAVTLPEELRPGQHHWLVWRVPPGTWSLRQARWKAGKQAGASVPHGGRAMATTVAVGEVAYVGEFTIDCSQPTTLSVGNDGGSAQTALALWPKVKAALVNRQLRDLRHQGK